MTSNNQNTILVGAGVTALALLLLSKSDNKPPGSTSPSLVYSGTTDFVKRNYPYAKAVQSTYKVPGIVSLGFAAVESGWGKHIPGNNYFGIKADKNWKGDFTSVKTPECFASGNQHLTAEILQIIPAGGYGSFAACTAKHDYTYWINDKFRKYSGAAASFTDYGVFLNQYYKKAFTYSDPVDFGTYVLTHGYATAQYVDTFKKIMSGIQEIIDTKL